MKKLMVAFAAIALAVTAQAAKTNWGFTNYYEGSDYADLGSCTAYLVLADNWNAEDVAGSVAKNIANASLAPGHYIETDPSQGGPYAMDYLEQTVVSDLSNSLIGNQDAYIVFFDGNKYAVSDKLSGSILADDDKSTYTGFVADSLAVSSADFKSVPEPTSGLLLLLGVAGMALRRRRA